MKHSWRQPITAQDDSWWKYTEKSKSNWIQLYIACAQNDVPSSWTLKYCLIQFLTDFIRRQIDYPCDASAHMFGGRVFLTYVALLFFACPVSLAGNARSQQSENVFLFLFSAVLLGELPVPKKIEKKNATYGKIS